MRISLLALVFATAVSGYGDLGHRTVGYLAEKYLSSTAKTLFDKLLANPHGYDYSDAAVWADSQKNSLPWSCPLHFINPVADKPPVHCEVTWPSDCPAEGCIISALVNFTSVVLDTRQPLLARKNATMFLMHLFGDLHQPLHVAGYRTGGNKLLPLCWKKAPDSTTHRCDGKLNLHAVWDTNLVHQSRGVALSLDTDKEKATAAKWAAELYNKKRDAAEVGKDCTELGSARCIVTWADESNARVCDSVLRRGEEWVLSHDLSKKYFEENAPVIDDLIGKAGIRLAAWLNAIAAATRGKADL